VLYCRSCLGIAVFWLRKNLFFMCHVLRRGFGVLVLWLLLVNCFFSAAFLRVLPGSVEGTPCIDKGDLSLRMFCFPGHHPNYSPELSYLFPIIWPVWTLSFCGNSKRSESSSPFGLSLSSACSSFLQIEDMEKPQLI